MAGGRAAATVGAVAALTIASCTQSSTQSTAALVVAPATSRADEPVTLHAEGVAAGTQATVTVAATDSAGLAWTASAPFAVGRPAR